MRQIYKSRMTFVVFGVFLGREGCFPNISGVHPPDFYITSFQNLGSEELRYLPSQAKPRRGEIKKAWCVNPRKIK